MAQTADIDKLEANVEKIREFTEEDRFNFLAEQWKELFLGSRIVSGVDSFLKQINILFLIFFGRSYALSLELLIAIVLWFLTWSVLSKYMKGVPFLKEGWQYIVASLILTIILAQAQVFNFISATLVKIIFLKSSVAWTLVTIVVVIVALIIYSKINSMIAAKMKKGKEAQKKKGLETKVEKQEAFIKGIKEGRKLVKKA